ncbi:MAG: hypothetical protein WC365_07640 [Candidatus Babeliales bacterium]
MPQEIAYRITNAIRFTIKEQSQFFKMGQPYDWLFNEIITVNNDYYLLKKSVDLADNPISTMEVLKHINPNIEKETITLYHCDFCGHITNAIGLYHKHVFDSHGQQHFLEIVHSDHEIKNLESLLPHDYSTEALNNVTVESNDTDSLSAKYISDDYEFYETISIKREFNEYGVCFFTLQITQYNRDNMVETSDTRINEYEESITEKQIAKIDNKADREITKWHKRKTWEIRDSYTCNLSVKADIASETNYSNYTHEQYFKAVTIECTTQNTEKLKALIAAKDIIINLYLNQ